MIYIHQFFLAFIPIFVAMDPIGILPIYISFTGELTLERKRRTMFQALGGAGVFAVLFLLVGNAFFRILGITADDFQIAGGLLLLILSIQDIMSAEKAGGPPANTDFGIVPLGIPLIAGPAVLTTELMLLNLYGALIIIAAIIANLLVAGLGLLLADNLRKMLGDGGIRAISKIVSLLLAAIAVMMIRHGVQGIVTHW